METEAEKASLIPQSPLYFNQHHNLFTKLFRELLDKELNNDKRIEKEDSGRTTLLFRENERRRDQCSPVK